MIQNWIMDFVSNLNIAMVNGDFARDPQCSVWEKYIDFSKV